MRMHSAWSEDMCFTCSSASSSSRRMAIQGRLTTRAPAAASGAASRPAYCRGPVIMMRLPHSGSSEAPACKNHSSALTAKGDR